jgi:phosphoglycolate phosphatase
MKFPLVVFDLDGTLVDSFKDIEAGVRHACAVAEVPPEESLLAMCRRGAPLEDFYAHGVGRAHDAPGEEARFASFVAAYRAHYLPGCVTTTTPYPGVVDGLRAIKHARSGVILAVATTKRTDTARRVLEGTGLAPLIDLCFGSDGLPPKPNPAVIRRVAESARVEVTRAIMIGDTDRDVRAAQAAPCAAVGVTWGGFAREELAPLAPDYLAATFAEVVAIVVGE